MKHLPGLLVVALLAACTADRAITGDRDVTHLAAVSLDTLPNGAVCQIGPDGGPPVEAPSAGDASNQTAGHSNPKPAVGRPVKGRQVATDRAAGDRAAGDQVVGNGAQPEPAQIILAERGIGGTGAPQAGVHLADRGIGGTGIVGIVTGFASVCVDGLEVAYDRSATVDIDGSAGTTAALRVGQIVVIEAKGPAAAPTAQSISVRRQVTGRIEALELGTGMLTIAGQPVSVPAGTWGADVADLGEWVTVSGLRRSDGVLIATRMDVAPADTLAVRGEVVRDGDTVRIGQLVLSGSAAADLKTGQSVMVSGRYEAGRAQIQSVTADPSSANPTAYFGAGVDRLVLQAYVRVANGAVYLNGLKVAAGPGVSGKPGADGIAVVSLERKGDGAFTVTRLRYTDLMGSSSGRPRTPNGDSWPAPVPAPQARRTGATLASLGGNPGGPVPGSQPSVASPSGLAPGGSVPAGRTSGTMGSTPMSPPLTVITPPAPVVSSIVVPPAPTVTAPTIMGPAITGPAITAPTTASPAGTTTSGTNPTGLTGIGTTGTGAKIESLPSPNTSQLMSSNPTPVPQSPVVTRMPKVAMHAAAAVAGVSHATVSMATQAASAPAAPIAAPGAATPAVLAPASSKAAGISTTGISTTGISTTGINPTGTRLRTPGAGGGGARGR